MKSVFHNFYLRITKFDTRPVISFHITKKIARIFVLFVLRCVLYGFPTKIHSTDKFMTFFRVFTTRGHKVLFGILLEIHSAVSTEHCDY